MWTRGRFVNEYVPGLFAVAIDAYTKRRSDSMWQQMCEIKTSKKKKEENTERSGLGLPQLKGEGGSVTYDVEIAGPKQSWVHKVYALAVNFLAAIKPCELLEHPNVQTRAISSQASYEEGSTTIRKEYTQASGSAGHLFLGDDIVSSAWKYAAVQ